MQSLAWGKPSRKAQTTFYYFPMFGFTKNLLDQKSAWNKIPL